MEGVVGAFVWMFPLADWVCLGKLRRGDVVGEEGLELVEGRFE